MTDTKSLNKVRTFSFHSYWERYNDTFTLIDISWLGKVFRAGGECHVFVLCFFNFEVEVRFT